MWRCLLLNPMPLLLTILYDLLIPDDNAGEASPSPLTKPKKHEEEQHLKRHRYKIPAQLSSAIGSVGSKRRADVVESNKASVIMSVAESWQRQAALVKHSVRKLISSELLSSLETPEQQLDILAAIKARSCFFCFDRHCNPPTRKEVASIASTNSPRQFCSQRCSSGKDQIHVQGLRQASKNPSQQFSGYGGATAKCEVTFLNPQPWQPQSSEGRLREMQICWDFSACYWNPRWPELVKGLWLPCPLMFQFHFFLYKNP